jgi:hypothetical protein
MNGVSGICRLKNFSTGSPGVIPTVLRGNGRFKTPPACFDGGLRFSEALFLNFD